MTPAFTTQVTEAAARLEKRCDMATQILADLADIDQAMLADKKADGYFQHAQKSALRDQIRACPEQWGIE